MKELKGKEPVLEEEQLCLSSHSRRLSFLLAKALRRNVNMVADAKSLILA